MVATALSDKKFDPPYVAKWMCENTSSGGAAGGTYNSDLTSEQTLNHFNLSVEVLFENGYSIMYIPDQGDKILKAVQEGKIIILNVPKHFTIVGPNSSCSKDEVYYYEISKKSKNGCYTPKELFIETYNRKSRNNKLHLLNNYYLDQQ